MRASCASSGRAQPTTTGNATCLPFRGIRWGCAGRDGLSGSLVGSSDSPEFGELFGNAVDFAEHLP
jgi:hypothetical protein